MTASSAMPDAPEVMTIYRRGAVWIFRSADGQPAAQAVPARRRTARVDLAGGRRLLILPDGVDGLQVLEDDQPLLGGERLDPWGRRWELSGNRYSYQLVNRSGFKGRWTIGPPGQATTELRMWTTRRIHVHAHLPVPVEVLAVAWYVIMRMAFALSPAGPAGGGHLPPSDSQSGSSG